MRTILTAGGTMREYVSSVTIKGQVTLPIAIRKHLGVGAPDRVAFVVEEDGRVALRPVELTAETLAGIMPALPDRDTDDFDVLIEEAMDDEADRIIAELREG
jgi:antitoxin PrlF